MAKCPECTCSNRSHLPWCSKFVEGVDTEAPLGMESQENFKSTAIAAIARMEKMVGKEKLAEMTLQYLLKHEQGLRSRLSSDNPAIILLDHYHAGEEWKRGD